MKTFILVLAMMTCVTFAAAQLSMPKVDTPKVDTSKVDTKKIESKANDTVKKADADSDVGAKELTRQLKNVQNDKGPIVFKLGKADLDAAKCENTLKTAADIIKAFPGFKVTIDGHTDNVGSAKANLKLSQKRAEAVRAYLISKYKIDAKRLAAKGYGSTQPIADNKTKEGQEKNRRVDFTVSKK
jgi:outer membrane protein OmpA-like peptidoglycan-associated protein